MSDSIIVRAVISIGISGCQQQEDHDTGISVDEWSMMSENERQSVIDDCYDLTLSNYSDGGAWVLNDGDE